MDTNITTGQQITWQDVMTVLTQYAEQQASAYAKRATRYMRALWYRLNHRMVRTFGMTIVEAGTYTAFLASIIIMLCVVEIAAGN